MNSASNENPCPKAAIFLERNPDDCSIYRVLKKVGHDVNNLFSKYPSWSCYAGEEYLTLNCDERGYYSVLTTNPEALGRAELNPFNQGEEQTRIGKFILLPNQTATVSHDEDVIVFEFSDDLRTLCLLVFGESKRYDIDQQEYYVLGLAEIRVA